MAKKKRMPKKPKQNASMDVIKRWEKRAAEVKKHNDAIDREKEAKRKILRKY